MFGCYIDGFTHWGGWFFGPIFLLAGVLIAWLVLHGAPKKPRNTDRNDSMQILKARLAKGEISLEEYNTLKSVL